VSRKTAPFYCCNNFVKPGSISVSPITSTFHSFHKVKNREPAEVLTAQLAQPSSCFVARRRDFIIAPNLWLLNMSDFTPVNYSILAMLQEWVCQHPMRDLISWGNVWLTERRSLIKRLIGGDLGWGHEWVLARGGHFKHLT